MGVHKLTSAARERLLALEGRERARDTKPGRALKQRRGQAAAAGTKCCCPKGLAGRVGSWRWPNERASEQEINDLLISPFTSAELGLLWPRARLSSACSSRSPCSRRPPASLPPPPPPAGDSRASARQQAPPARPLAAPREGAKFGPPARSLTSPAGAGKLTTATKGAARRAVARTRWSRAICLRVGRADHRGGDKS